MEIPTYGELLKLTWFLIWRNVVILFFAMMTIAWSLPVILNTTVSESSQFLLNIFSFGVWFFGIVPFTVKTLFQKQFQGFQVAFQRDTGASSSS